jgi:hypothetical protein
VLMQRDAIVCCRAPDKCSATYQEHDLLRVLSPEARELLKETQVDVRVLEASICKMPTNGQSP